MPDWVRTSDLQSRSLTLYPAELRAHNQTLSNCKQITCDCQGVKSVKNKLLSTYASHLRVDSNLLGIMLIPQSFCYRTRAIFDQLICHFFQKVYARNITRVSFSWEGFAIPIIIRSSSRF